MDVFYISRNYKVKIVFIRHAAVIWFRVFSVDLLWGECHQYSLPPINAHRETSALF